MEVIELIFGVVGGLLQLAFELFVGVISDQEPRQR